MGSKGSSEYRARQRDRERRRRQEKERSSARVRQPLDPTAAGARSGGTARRAAASPCGWCHGPIPPRSRGPIPKWCSATCRHRAWEQSRAAASGRSAVQSLNEWSPFPPWPASQSEGLDSTTGWTFCKSSPLRSTAARSTTGTWPRSPRLSTTSSGLSYDAAAIPGARRRRGRGEDSGVTLGRSHLEEIFRCHPGLAVTNRPGSAPSDGDGPPSVLHRRCQREKP